MAEMEDKINSILSDPKMMQQIMSMAQALGANQPDSEGPKEEKSPLLPFRNTDISGIFQGFCQICSSVIDAMGLIQKGH